MDDQIPLANSGTAPRTARTHDVSHLADHRSTLQPQLPASQIKEEDFVACRRLIDFHPVGTFFGKCPSWIFLFILDTCTVGFSLQFWTIVTFGLNLVGFWNIGMF